jgi:hypothetical protein
VQLKSEVLGNHLPVVAKWDHILKLHELNKLSMFRLLYKLTHTHLNPVAQSAMKEPGCAGNEPCCCSTLVASKDPALHSVKLIARC